MNDSSDHVGDEFAQPEIYENDDYSSMVMVAYMLLAQAIVLTGILVIALILWMR